MSQLLINVARISLLLIFSCSFWTALNIRDTKKGKAYACSTINTRRISQRGLSKVRNKRGLSQSALPKLVGLHVTNISRYERGENKPTSAVLTKLADALSISTDYLMSGSIEDNAEQSIFDKTLFAQSKIVEQLPENKKRLVKEFLDAFIIKSDLQKQLAILVIKLSLKKLIEF